MDELKPCPFCGEIPDANVIYPSSGITFFQEFDVRKPIIQVGCRHCGIDISHNLVFWNTRPAEDALKAEIEELRYLEKQFESWGADSDTGCPKYQYPDYPCEGEKKVQGKVWRRFRI